MFIQIPNNNRSRMCLQIPQQQQPQQNVSTNPQQPQLQSPSLNETSQFLQVSGEIEEMIGCFSRPNLDSCIFQIWKDIEIMAPIREYIGFAAHCNFVQTKDGPMPVEIAFGYSLGTVDDSVDGRGMTTRIVAASADLYHLNIPTKRR
ncbi:hypothetical protein CEXT_538411 [Caerostris extrusa]|uniref:Uncharacterized protein n=1 Tax=Caerostris extrusa TaxID=172846 RepID=A0AAV4SFN6_CAEEX|nr:hypothetical protein CEXT_538411 [Caerostris extrusa]